MRIREFMFSNNLSKVYVLLLCLILASCNHPLRIKGKGDYQLKRLPTENCKYLKQQITQPNQDINTQKSDYRFHTKTGPEPKAVYLEHDDLDKHISKKQLESKKITNK